MRPPARAALGLLLGLLLGLPREASPRPTPCRRCRELVDKFNQGMVDTAKKNFGGGNTAWEEKSLSKYESSEVRLLEIVEGLCGSSDFECNRLVEEHEEQLEAWWLRLKKKHPDLFEWFCVKTLKVCCPPGTYGPDCLACQGGSERPCSGNGRCSGDGSREGDGSCQCHPGYRGALCTDCMDGYFSALRNETHSVCTACHESCKLCTGPTSRDCTQCQAGWASEDGACVDVDECAAETPPCSEQQFCQNVGGSFQCEECDPTCAGCTGKGPGQCKECIAGYTKESGQCADVDECSLPEKPCLRKHENCYNTPGSYVCVCPEGFEETEDACVQAAQPAGEEVTAETPTPPPSREDL
ncbi:protein disulfide isomerase CRELD2 [Pipistrellus kuhlii]|uniref:protein disulfide-isomerase n=1 Tax=Pipistrellus kuhlii TaxID=59472 RepID=A0A7J7R3M4_PIPKU|nr:protein disulfide isomerase CRELD2 [Pipistrellus kuhlii]KAF6270565.1 cysteine rich with EGF like domains 2 [Pipistrellus kuhlii]